MGSKEVQTNSSKRVPLPLTSDDLRSTYESVTRSTYSRTIGLLLVVAGFALGGAVFLVSVRGVLLAIAATGVFGAILLQTVTPERFLTASLTRSLYGVTAENIATVVQRLDLAGTPRYVPTDTGIRLFVPAHDQRDVPDTLETRTVDDSLVLEPTGRGLHDEFERQGGVVPNDRVAALDTLTSALTDQFALADEATIESVTDTHTTIHVYGSIFDDDTDIDHPVQSFLAVGLARTLGKTIKSTMAEYGGDGELLITLRWRPDDQSDDDQ